MSLELSCHSIIQLQIVVNTNKLTYKLKTNKIRYRYIFSWKYYIFCYTFPRNCVWLRGWRRFWGTVSPWGTRRGHCECLVRQLLRVMLGSDLRISTNWQILRASCFVVVEHTLAGFPRIRTFSKKAFVQHFCHLKVKSLVCCLICKSSMYGN